MNNEEHSFTIETAASETTVHNMHIVADKISALYRKYGSSYVEAEFYATKKFGTFTLRPPSDSLSTFIFTIKCEHTESNELFLKIMDSISELGKNMDELENAHLLILPYSDAERLRFGIIVAVDASEYIESHTISIGINCDTPLVEKYEEIFDHSSNDGRLVPSTGDVEWAKTKVDSANCLIANEINLQDIGLLLDAAQETGFKWGIIEDGPHLLVAGTEMKNYTFRIAENSVEGLRLPEVDRKKVPTVTSETRTPTPEGKIKSVKGSLIVDEDDRVTDGDGERPNWKPGSGNTRATTVKRIDYDD